MLGRFSRLADGGDRAKQLISRAYKKIDWLESLVSIKQVGLVSVLT